MSGDACCEHSLRWHHEERGCGYHGYAPEHRCPCLLPFDAALAAHDAAIRAEAEAEVADAFVKWAMVNEIADVPLDWAWFGEITRRYWPSHPDFHAAQPTEWES